MGFVLLVTGLIFNSLGKSGVGMIAMRLKQFGNEEECVSLLPVGARSWLCEVFLVTNWRTAENAVDLGGRQ